MGNTQKSWKGAPTTNLLPAATVAHTGGVGSYFNGVISANNTEKGDLSFKVTTANNVYQDGFITSSSGNLTNGVTYSYSLDMWIPSGKTVSVRMRMITGGGSLASSVVSVTGTDKWQRVTKTFTADTNTSGSIEGVETSNPADVISFWIKNLQLEQTSFATPFVNGTRTTANAIIDLMNTSTITASSLTYNSDGTFSFNGTTNHITVSSGFSNISSGVTLNCFAKINSNSGSWSRLFDFGTGQSLNNVGFARSGTTQTLAFFMYPTGEQLDAVGAITYGNIAMYTATANGTNWVIYVNGVQVATVARATLPTNVTRTSNYIGRSNWASDGYLNGNIYLSQVYNRALSAAEVQQNFNALRGRYEL
jgi:hypothetical protein